MIKLIKAAITSADEIVIPDGWRFYQWVDGWLGEAHVIIESVSDQANNVPEVLARDPESTTGDRTERRWTSHYAAPASAFGFRTAR
jgi:hypothetical protein